MHCSDCYWCVLNHALSNEKVCCNDKSENYNILFPKEESTKRGCSLCAVREEVYNNGLNPWNN